MKHVDNFMVYCIMTMPLDFFPAGIRDEVAGSFVTHKMFEGMPDPSGTQESINKVISNLQEMKPEEIEGLFLTVLMKSPTEMKCDECSEVHCGTTQYLAFIGGVDTVEKVTRHGLTRAKEYARGNMEEGTVVMADDDKKSVVGPSTHTSQ